MDKDKALLHFLDSLVFWGISKKTLLDYDKIKDDLPSYVKKKEYLSVVDSYSDLLKEKIISEKTRKYNGIKMTYVYLASKGYKIWEKGRSVDWLKYGRIYWETDSEMIIRSFSIATNLKLLMYDESPLLLEEENLYIRQEVLNSWYVTAFRNIKKTNYAWHVGIKGVDNITDYLIQLRCREEQPTSYYPIWISVSDLIASQRQKKVR